MENFLSDTFASCRPIFELFNANCSKYFVPSPYLTIDETLYSKRHQISFRQFNPDKSRKYGPLLKSLNDASLPYALKSAPYAGKPPIGDGSYYIDSTENYMKYLMNATETDVSLKGQNISTDRLYTNIPLADWLFDRNITTVGTLNSNRMGIPDELKNPKEREEFGITCHFEKEKRNFCLSSCMVKSKSKGKRNVLLLSTTRPLRKKTRDDQKRKPSMHNFFLNLPRALQILWIK